MPDRRRTRYLDAMRAGASHEEALRLAQPLPSGRPRADSLDVPIARDPIAQRALEEHPDGMRLDEIAGLYGVSDELVRLIERQALTNLGATISALRLPYLHDTARAE